MIVTCPTCGFRHLIFDRQCPVCKLPRGMAWALGRPAGSRSYRGAASDASMAIAVLEAALRAIVLVAAVVVAAVVSAIIGIAGSGGRRALGGGMGVGIPSFRQPAGGALGWLRRCSGGDIWDGRG